MSSKRAFMSELQKKKLIYMLRNNEELIRGKFSLDFTHKKAQQQWSEIAKNLNAMPGANKNWEQWRKTWGDIKKNAKKKNSQRNILMRGTGGGPNVNITEDEDAVIDLLQVTAVEGDENVMESNAHIALPEPRIVDNFEILEISSAELQHESKLPSTAIHDKAVCENPVQGTKRTYKKIPLKALNLRNSVSASSELIRQNEEIKKLKEKYYADKMHIKKEQLEIDRENLKCRKEEILLLKADIEIKTRLACILEELI